MRPFLTVWIFLAVLAQPAAAEEIEPRDVATLTTLIQSRGYNCPLVKRVTNLGPDAYGHAFQLFCGPVNGDKYDLFAAFRLTEYPDGRLALAPCSFWSCEVDD